MSCGFKWLVNNLLLLKVNDYGNNFTLSWIQIRRGNMVEHSPSSITVLAFALWTVTNALAQSWQHNGWHGVHGITKTHTRPNIIFHEYLSEENFFAEIAYTFFFRPKTPGDSGCQRQAQVIHHMELSLWCCSESVAIQKTVKCIALFLQRFYYISFSRFGLHCKNSHRAPTMQHHSYPIRARY